jgi:hypothetical protein
MSHPLCYNRLMIIETDMKDKLFQLTLVTQVDPSRPACKQTETIQAFDLRAAFKIAARMFPDESRLGEIRVKEIKG